jgi:hypothetical protein
VTGDHFSERMRERMPAHEVWRHKWGAPVMSRPAQDAMWDDMRDRLRTLDHLRDAQTREGAVKVAWDRLVRPVGPRSVAAIVVAGVLLLLALVGLTR